MASKIRKTILDNAIKCFAQRGYAGCSTAEICEKANVSEHSLFRLFGSKEQLFSECLSASLAAPHPRRSHLRIAAFALLEGQGLSDEHRAAFRKLRKVSPLIKELLNIS